MLSKLLMTLALIIAATGCATRIEPGNVGLKISNLGSDKGISADVLGTGYTFYTPGLIEWKRLELQQQAVGRWNGSVPTVSMGGGGAVPFVDVTKFANK